MLRCVRLIVLLLVTALAAGCVQLENMMRTVEVERPLTARPIPPAPAAAPNGAIYQASTFVPLFEDQRARRIGDILTVRIEERLNTLQQEAA